MTVKPLAIAATLALLASAAPALAAGRRAPEPLAPLDGRIDLAPLRDLAVQDGGRRKPLDTFAREKVKSILGTERYEGQDPVYTLVSMLFEPDRWESIEAIKISNLKLVKLFAKTSKVNRLSLAEVARSEAFAGALAGIDPSERSPDPFERAVREIHHRRLFFYSLASMLRPIPVPGATPNQAWSSIAGLEGQPPAVRDAVSEIYGAAREAFRAGDAAGANEALGRFAAKVGELQAPLAPPRWKLALERMVNVYDPLRLAYMILIGAALFLGVSVMTRGRASYAIGAALLAAGVALSVGALAARTIIVERAPVSNLYEAASFAVVMAVVVGALFEIAHRNGLFGTVGAIFGALGALLIDYAGMDATIQPLVPVLRSYWLNIHVTAMLVSYGIFALALILAIYYFAKWFPAKGLPRATILLPLGIGLIGFAMPIYRIISTGGLPEPLDYLVAFLVAPAAAMGAGWLLAKLRRGAKIPYEREIELKTIERYLHRVCMVGLWVLTVGIILGAVWANESWGRYWGWDPKETWAFITWMVYAIYVHGRIAGFFRGAAAAVFQVLGFYAVLFTFFGVSYILPGLHSYLSS